MTLVNKTITIKICVKSFKKLIGSVMLLDLLQVSNHKFTHLKTCRWPLKRN